MHDLSGTYVHYGDRLRRRRKVRAGVILTGFLVASVTAAADWRPDMAGAASVSNDTIAPAGGDNLAFTGKNLERWERVFAYARRYGIKADLAAAIYDEASAQKIDPELAFRVVRLESRFDERARSPVGAIGLTQLMPATARYYERGVTVEKLHDRHTNLRIGFRYLHDLLKEYRSVRTALLVYNRGPEAVLIERELGIDPSNGYDQIVLKGYRGSGLLK
jgi:soluble lytic murein transglycosylase-like protein